MTREGLISTPLSLLQAAAVDSDCFLNAKNSVLNKRAKISLINFYLSQFMSSHNFA